MKGLVRATTARKLTQRWNARSKVLGNVEGSRIKPAMACKRGCMDT